MPNHYDNLPIELTVQIESFLKIKPEDVKKIIENPPVKYKKMLDTWHESALLKLDKYGKYPYLWRKKRKKK